jgi:hypothetical protein
LIGAGLFAVANVGRREVAISQPLLKDGFGDLAMQGQPFRLFVLLIPSEVEPAQTFKDRVYGGLGVALDIGVIESENHRSSMMAGVKPVKDKGTGAADMQKAGWRRSESNAKHNFRV